MRFSCRHPRSIFRLITSGVLLIGCAFLSLGPANAADIKLEVKPPDANFRDFSLSVRPSDLIIDPEAAAVFDEATGGWVIQVRPLEGFLTELSLALERPDTSLPRPPLRLALPSRDAIIEIVIPFSENNPDARRVRAIYQGRLPAEDQTDWLSEFFAARNLITFLTEGSSATQIEPSAPLARALVVYSESMQKLLTRTDWFGVPSDAMEIGEMLKIIVASARQDGYLRSRINISRLDDAFKYIKEAEHHLYSRIWQAVVEIPDYRCEKIFPIARQFYDHLRRLPQERYRSIRETARFTRSQVLLESTRCLRELISIKPGIRFAMPEVIEGPFGGRPPREIVNEIRNDLTQELEAVQQESGRQQSGASCDAGGKSATGTERQLCHALTYVRQLEGMLTEEGHVTVD